MVDPIDQRERFEKQALAKAQGDEDAMTDDVTSPLIAY